MKNKAFTITGYLILTSATLLALLIEVVNPHSFLSIQGAFIRAAILTITLAAYVTARVMQKKTLSTTILSNLVIADLAYTASALTMHE
jgi:hypothetical protein